MLLIALLTDCLTVVTRAPREERVAMPESTSTVRGCAV
jgi:hypothetical protein